MKPDYFLVLPWHFIDTFTRNFKKYIEDGGQLIVPMPRPLRYFITKEIDYTEL